MLIPAIPISQQQRGSVMTALCCIAVRNQTRTQPGRTMKLIRKCSFNKAIQTAMLTFLFSPPAFAADAVVATDLADHWAAILSLVIFAVALSDWYTPKFS